MIKVSENHQLRKIIYIGHLPFANRIKGALQFALDSGLLKRRVKR
jgi:hypothetical protein